MASVLFGLELADTVELIQNEIEPLPNYYKTNLDILIRQFSWSYLVDRVSAYREIDTLVILIDEVMILENELKEKFSKSNYDFTNVFRSALLNKNISIDKTIHCTLAISSLSY